MAARRPQTGAPPPGAAGGSGRSNEYFVPRDGIDREVITADICRYLGNDALVRPGHYENPQSGQVTQGYYITAYRNLTTAMIDDLKADSARWEAERRQQAARNAPSGSGYRDSATHNARQYHGPTSDNGPGGYPDRGDSYDNVRYPGSVAPGYSGNSGGGGGYSQSASQPQYPASGGYYANQGPAQSYTQPSDPRFPSGSQAPPYGAEPPYAAAGAHSANRYPDYPSAGVPQGSRGISSSGAPPQAGTYISSNAPQLGGGYSGQGGFYPPSGGNPPFGAPPPVQSQDPLYGRGASQAFNAAQGQHQYEAPPQRGPAPSSRTQPMASSGNAPPSRTRERDSADRHHSDRHRPPPRR